MTEHWNAVLSKYRATGMFGLKRHSSAFFHSDSFGKVRASKTKAILAVFYESHETNLNNFFLVIASLFRPNKQHIDALNSLLLNVEREMGLSQADIQGRQAVAQEVQTLLRPHLPGTNYFEKSINLKTAYVTCGLQQVGHR